jgi:hypothetical protein
MERRPKTLQQMFNDAQEIQHNILTCEQIRSEELGVPGHENEYEQRTFDWNPEHKTDDIIGPLEPLNENDFTKDYIPLVERKGSYVVFDPPHDKHGVDCFMYSSIDSQKDKCADQSVEEPVDVPSFFLLDNIADVVGFPIYDEYDDDYDNDLPEQPTTFPLSENVLFQQYNERNQLTYHSYREDGTETTEGNSFPLCFSSFKLLKENAKIIIETKENMLMPNHTDPLRQFDKELQPLVRKESEKKCVQQPREMERCAYDRSKENEENFESDERTLPLCFSSFKLLKQDVNNVPDQKSSRCDVEYPEYSGLANENHLPLCFSSFELLKANHEITEEAGKSDDNGTTLHGKIVISEEDQQPSYALNDHVDDYMEGYFGSDLQHVLNYQLENENEADQKIVIKGHFPSPELNKDLHQYFQQDKVFQSCLSSPMNEVIVKFLSGLDMDEDFETAFIEISNSEQKSDIEFQESNKTMHVTFQSEIQKDDEEAVVLFDSFENHGFENASMGTLECETVHVVSFPHLQEYYEQELTPFHSLVSQSNSPQTNFQKVNKVEPNYKRMVLMHIICRHIRICSNMYECFC